MIFKTNVAIFEKKLSFKSFSSVKFVQKSPFSILLMSAQTVNYYTVFQAMILKLCLSS